MRACVRRRWIALDFWFKQNLLQMGNFPEEIWMVSECLNYYYVEIKIFNTIFPLAVMHNVPFSGSIVFSCGTGSTFGCHRLSFLSCSLVRFSCSSLSFIDHHSIQPAAWAAYLFLLRLVPLQTNQNGNIII